MRIALGFALLVLGAACGSKGKPAAPVTATGSGTELSSGHHEGEQTTPPEIKQFHDLLAPLWHSPQGPERMQKTCAAVPDFQAGADAIAKATPPTTANADKWTEGTRALVAATGKLADACASKDMGKFETAFAATHDAFHSLMTQAGLHQGSGAMHHEGSAAPTGSAAHQHHH